MEKHVKPNHNQPIPQKGFNGQLDLDDLARRHRLRLEIVPDDPVNDRFQQDQKGANARFQRWKDLVLFGVAVILTTIVSGICIWIVVAQNFSIDDKKWATSILTLTIGGLLGYLIGKGSG
jgi:hypothetical protein